MDEQAHLETIASKSTYAEGTNFNTIKHSAQIFKRYFRGRTILELGPAEGVMTEELYPLGYELTVVDGSSAFCADVSRRYPNSRVVHSLFEEFEPEARFDNIVLGHVLEHVEDPVAILKRVHGWLAQDGRVMAAVPNSRSLHRQAAVLMGLLPFEEELNEADHGHGHRRVYNPETFRRDFIQSGLKTEIFGGYWLKPLSNRQLEEAWTQQMLDAFMILGERYPDIAGEIYIVAGR